MPQRVRIADRFKTQSAEQLVTTAGAVITGLTNNPTFPAPTVDLKAAQAAADDLNAALAAQAHGGVAATAEKNNKQEALIIVLRKLKHYVEDSCGNDLAVLLSSGFQAASTTRNRWPLANPSILSVDLGNSTELVLKVTPIARAKCYEVRIAAVGAQEVSHLQYLVFGGTAHSFCASLKNVVERSNTGRLILCLPAGPPLSSP
jgi:hypothetical protein